MAEVERLNSVITEHRLHATDDVIDVDLFDDEIVESRPARLPVPRADSNVITILDSDDEDMVVQAGPSQPRQTRSNHRHFISPPPPPQNRGGIPPVPGLPHHLQGQGSFPMRRHPPPHPTDIVRPNDQPFAFEVMAARRRREEADPRPPMVAAPPSHHQPVMGLGGALLAMNRIEAQPRPGRHAHFADRHHHQLPRPRQRPERRWILPSFGEIFGGLGIVRRGINVMGGDEDFLEDDDFEDEDDALLFAHRGRPFFFADQARRNLQPEIEYNSSYTHPDKPAPGFTFDFAPPQSTEVRDPSSVIVIDDSPGPSTTGSSNTEDPSTSTILVCARCMDPLVTGDSMTGEEHSKRRIWGLRCGHMFDAKCIDELMKPRILTAEIVATSDRKGKGKAKAMQGHEFDHANVTQTQSEDDNPIRSRLRSRHSSSTFQPYSTGHLSPPTSRPTRPLPRRSRWKGKAKVPVVEAEHQWACPVAGCGMMHTSLLTEGKWGMDEKTGAIAMYV